MTAAIQNTRPVDAPQLELAPAVPPEAQGPQGSIAKDGLVLSEAAQQREAEDPSLWDRGVSMARTAIRVVGDSFDAVKDIIASTFAWNTMMMQWRSVERARERREEAEREAQADHALTVSLAQEAQQRAEQRRQG